MIRIKRQALTWGLGILTGLIGAAISLADGQIPPERQALLLMKTLSYDRKLKDRTGGDVVVAVVGREGKAGGACGAVYSAVTEAAQQMKVGGLSVRAVEIEYGDQAQFEKKLQGAKPAAIYVCEGLEKAADSLVATARRLGTLSFTPVDSLVGKGLSVGLILRDEKAVIRVNVKASRQEGADLDPQLLRLAEIVE